MYFMQSLPIHCNISDFLIVWVQINLYKKKPIAMKIKLLYALINFAYEVCFNIKKKCNCNTYLKIMIYEKNFCKFVCYLFYFS